MSESIKISFTPSYCYFEDIPQDLEEKIYGLLSFHPEGYFYSPKYQSGVWDGYNRLYYPSGKRFRSGLLSRVIEFLVDTDYDALVENLPQSQDYKQNSSSYILRNYQLKAVKSVCTKRFGILKSPARSGKTMMFIATVDSERKFPAVFFCRSLDLAYQTVQRLQEFLPDVSIGMVGDGKADLRDVNVITIQSAYAAYGKAYPEKVTKKEAEPSNEDKLKIKRSISASKIVFYDECFDGKTLICIDETTALSIEYVYKCKSITHVLSYDTETKQFESKKILKKFKKIVSYNSMFEVGTRVIRIGGENRKTKYDYYNYAVRCTDNHKFWTNNRGYVSAKELSCSDNIKILYPFNRPNRSRIMPTFCPKCNLKFKSFALLDQHFFKKHTTKGKKYCKNVASKIDYRNMVEKREKNGMWKKSLKEMGKRRRGKNNLIFRYPDTILKIQNTHRKLFRNKTEKEKKQQILRFMQAPKYRSKMNKPESIVNDFKFDNLEYTGNGYHKNRKFAGIKIILNGKNRYKFPDFTYRQEKKIIEVVDFEYWHTQEEMASIKRSYKDAGWLCLIVDAKKIVKNTDMERRRIYKFLYNHDVTPTYLKYNSEGYRNTVTVYDLEVEDNHNYFANGFLVSNCHHTQSRTSRYILEKCINTTMKIGLSATPHADKEEDMLIEESIGPIIHDISYSELIREGYLLKPYIYMYKLPKMEIDGNYKSVYKQALTDNSYLTKLISKITKKLNSQGKSVVVQTELISHTKNIAKEIVDSVVLTGSDDAKYRQEVIEKLNRKEILCVVSTLFEEGLDLPFLDYTINAAGGLSSISTLQRMRSITAINGKTTCGIIDFYHQCKYLKRHSKVRKETYESEPEFVIIERDVSKKSIEEIV